MKRHIALTLCLVAACMIYAQALGVPSGDVTDQSPGLQNEPTVRAGFHNISSIYYVYINPDTYFTWGQAVQACNILNMALISYETQHKWETIEAYLRSNGLSALPFWTSGHKVMDNFFWTGSGQAFTYTSWLPDQPNSDGADVCVYSVPSAGWYDVTCDLTYFFICE